MGLLDQVGQVLGGLSQQSTAQAGRGGKLLQLLMAYIQSQPGGLPGLIERFQQAGLAGLAASWVGDGQNQAISSDQVEAVLGSDAVDNIATEMGGSRADTLSGLSALLPTLIDQLTPKGQLEDGLDLGAALGELSKRLLG